MNIGLTGRICSGKNYISAFFKDKGFELLDLDREAESLRTVCQNEIINTFGTDDKKELARIVFNNSEALKMLENILYPPLLEMIKKKENNLLLNGALLQRAGLDKICSFVVFLNPSFETRLSFAKMRGLTEEEFILRDSSQKDVVPNSALYSCPLYVIENKPDADPDSIFSLLPKF